MILNPSSMDLSRDAELKVWNLECCMNFQYNEVVKEVQCSGNRFIVKTRNQGFYMANYVIPSVSIEVLRSNFIDLQSPLPVGGDGTFLYLVQIARAYTGRDPS
ncbi:hypothetical protein IFM89_036117 [Coptis chinensis]|uniref:Uncharacterized protein n=1 Tax=Coptis chinensis TaxID=261450 RepID=A0A835LXU3_9MAGN|nr:hypothetical protein IFM89_036117 [Coptis chinensis]